MPPIFTRTRLTASPETGYSSPDHRLGFETIDGEIISWKEGAAALRSGAVVMVGGLLVGLVRSNRKIF